MTRPKNRDAFRTAMRYVAVLEEVPSYLKISESFSESKRDDK